MSMTNEQIQALRAAAESCGKQEPLSLVVYHGKMCLRNKGGIVFTVLRDICFPEYSAENENYARLAELCTSDSILSLLAERDADKTLIAEQAKRIAELEAKTLTVMLPEPPGPMSVGARTVYCGIMADVVGAFQEACAAAGITLVVGE